MDGFVEINRFLVSSLEYFFDLLRVFSYSCCIPLMVDSRGIELEELAAQMVNPCKKNAHSERPHSSGKSELLEQACDVSSHVSYQNGLFILKLVSHWVFSSLLHDHPEVSEQTCKSCPNVWRDHLNLLNRVAVNHWRFQILLSNQNHAFGVLNSNGVLPVLHCLQSILDLLKRAFGVKDCQWEILGHYKRNNFY